MSRPNRRQATFTGLIAVLLLAGPVGCSLSSTGPQGLDGPQVRAGLESSLLVPLKSEELVESSASFTNVEAIYSGGTATETFLVVVFETPEAAVQILGEASTRDQIAIQSRNVVVLYNRGRTAVNRDQEIRDALDALTG